MFGSIDGNGKLAAVNVVRLHRSGYTSPGWWEKMWEMRILLEQMWSGSLPAVFANSKRKSLQQHIDTRVKKVFDETLYKLHARYAPGPHANALARLTHPAALGDALRRGTVPRPRTRPPPDAPPSPKSWQFGCAKHPGSTYTTLPPHLRVRSPNAAKRRAMRDALAAPCQRWQLPVVLYIFIWGNVRARARRGREGGRERERGSTRLQLPRPLIYDLLQNKTRLPLDSPPRCPDRSTYNHMYMYMYM